MVFTYSTEVSPHFCVRRVLVCRRFLLIFVPSKSVTELSTVVRHKIEKYYQGVLENEPTDVYVRTVRRTDTVHRSTRFKSPVFYSVCPFAIVRYLLFPSYRLPMGVYMCSQC